MLWSGKGRKRLIEERIKDATKILNLLRSMSGYKPHFEIIGNYRLIDDGVRPEATIMLRANGKEMHEAETGVGPVDALAKVLKKSLKSIFPEIDQVKLMILSYWRPPILTPEIKQKCLNYIIRLLLCPKLLAIVGGKRV